MCVRRDLLYLRCDGGVTLSVRTALSALCRLSVLCGGRI